MMKRGGFEHLAVGRRSMLVTSEGQWNGSSRASRPKVPAVYERGWVGAGQSPLSVQR